jgi:hypothetical protein
MGCKECSYNLIHLHKLGVIPNDIFIKIIAGHSNKDILKLIESMKPSMKMYNSIKYIPKYLMKSFKV